MRKQSDTRLELKDKMIILNDTQLKNLKGGTSDENRRSAHGRCKDIIVVDDLAF